jgi:hypothetical protein
MRAWPEQHSPPEDCRLPQRLLDLEDAIGGNIPEFLSDSGRPPNLHQVHDFALA